MNRLTSALLLTPMALVLTACGSSSSPAPTSSTATSTSGSSSTPAALPTSSAGATPSVSTITSTVTTTRQAQVTTQSANVAPAPAAASPAPTSSSATDQPTVVDCHGGTAGTRPSRLILECGHGHSMLDKITWTTWSASGASGTADLAIATCTPDCATGGLDRTRVPVRLSAPAAVDGAQRFTQLAYGSGSTATTVTIPQK